MSKKTTSIPHLLPRRPDAHKGDFRRVLIVAGSRGMIGAPALVANAALRCGAGLVRIATSCSVQPTVAALAPCATSLALPEDDLGRISRTALNDILNALTDNDCLALGPGLGQSNDLQTILTAVIRECKLPAVFDADGLNNLAALNDDTLRLNNNTILTPHPGEMRRLWQLWFREEIPHDRTEQAEKLAQRSGAIVILKGAGTVVTDGQNTYVNTTGNPGMATGGAGDVLTGCVAGLLASTANQSLSFFDASVLAVFLHGRAGDLAADALTQTALIASDLVDFLPDAFRSL